MTKKDVLRQLEPLFSKVAAEFERRDLPSYFVETSAWRQILNGGADIIMGPKGSGKSALHIRLLQERQSLAERGVELISAEEPLATSVFKDALSPPRSGDRAGRAPALVEAWQFAALWRLYILTVVVRRLCELSAAAEAPTDARLEALAEPLTAAGLLPRDGARTLNARETLRAVLGWVESFKVDLLVIKAKVRNPKGRAETVEFNVEDMLGDLDDLLEAWNLTVWVLLDRLDEAFEGMPARREAEGLSSLLDTHAYFMSRSRIRLKLFVRSDIYARALMGNARHAQWDHFNTRTTIDWTDAQLCDVVLRRMALSTEFRRMYGLGPEPDYDTDSLFSRVMPKPLDGSAPMAWIRSRLCDGNGKVSPRNVVNLIHTAIGVQLDRPGQPPDDALFDLPALEAGLAGASGNYYELAFLPSQDDRTRRYVRALTGTPYGHTVFTLDGIWRSMLPDSRAPQSAIERVARDLAKLGVLTELENGRFEVAPLFRAALRVKGYSAA